MLESNAAKHERTHTGERPYMCQVPDCGASFTQWIALVRHKMLHENRRPYVCTAENCDASYIQPGNLKVHFERNHSARALLRRKRKEERLNKGLRAMGFAPDRETLVDFCGMGSKTFARIDFVIYKEDRIVCVECDEDSHRREGVLCDVTRMLDVTAQHRMRSELPLHFIRFNPDGYTVDGGRPKPHMNARIKELLLAIEEPVSTPLAITYICYDTTNDVADAVTSAEFPPDLRDSCKTRLA
jgi:hypothetical protein